MKPGKWDRSRLLADTIVPWYTYEAVLWLYQNARPEWNVLEWGAGASTIWFARHCAAVSSIESDEKWSIKIEEDFGIGDGEAAAKSEILFVPGQPKGSRPYYSNVTKLYHVEAAETPIEAWAPQRYDIVSVDGRARNGCMYHAIADDLVKPGGYLLLDNSERKKYDLGRSFVPKDWHEMKFYGPGRGCPTLPGVTEGRLRTWQTTIWRRPV